MNFESRVPIPGEKPAVLYSAPKPEGSGCNDSAKAEPDRPAACDDERSNQIDDSSTQSQQDRLEVEYLEVVKDDATNSLRASLSESSKSEPSESMITHVHQSIKDRSASLSQGAMMPPTLHPRSKKQQPVPKPRPTSYQENPSATTAAATATTTTATITTQMNQRTNTDRGVPSSVHLVTSNHAKRLRSGKCREDWTLPTVSRKFSHPSISEAEEVVTLSQLVTEHARHFPLSVVLIKGLEDQVVPQSTVNIHFLKLTKVVDGSDFINQRYLFPYDSILRFGLVYCPGVKIERYFFERVSDIIQAPDLPKVVTCTKKVKGKNESCSICADEVLIVLDRVSPSPGKSKKSKLKVFSFTTKTGKMLSADMAGKFTTDPVKAPFSLLEIIKYIPNPFPVSVRLYLDDSKTEFQGRGGASTLPNVLMKDPVLLLDTTVETSVIATCEVCNSSSSSSDLTSSGAASDSNSTSSGRATTATTAAAAATAASTVVEIPVNQDILVSFQSSKEDSSQDSYETLRANTLALWKEMMSPTSKMALRRLGTSSPTQQKLYSMTSRGSQKREYQAIKAPLLLEKELLSDKVYALPCGGAGGAAVSTDQEKLQYMPLLSSTVSSEYMSPSESIEMDSSVEVEEEQFVGGFSRLKKTPVRPKVQEKDHMKDLQSNQRLVRRIEALELRVAGAASHDKMQRLSRRVEALEMRLAAMPYPSQQQQQQQQQQQTKAAPKSDIVSQREEALQEEVECLRATCKSLEDGMKMMWTEMKDMAEQIRTLPKNDLKVQKQQTPEENREELKMMSSEQIGKLLEALGLHQYKAGFLEEVVTGEILSECGEDVLEELGMTDPTHRQKLLNVIQGESSPLALIVDYSYVRFKSTTSV